MLSSKMLIFLFVSLSCSIYFKNCPSYTNLKSPQKNIFFFRKEPIYLYEVETFNSENELETISQCSRTLLPLDYVEKEKGDIYIFTKRYLSKPITDLSTKRKVLFVFPTQTGTSIDALEQFSLKLFHELKNKDPHDIYLIDHRGVGRSNRIGCPISNAETEGSDGGIEIVVSEIDGCKDDFINTYGSEVLEFSTTVHARDVINIIKKINATTPNYFQENSISFFGSGYGSFIASRIMQIIGEEESLEFQNLMNKVILDSVFSQSPDESSSEGRTTVDKWNINFNEVGLSILDYCKSDTFCSDKFISLKPKNPLLQFSKLSSKEFLFNLISLLFDQNAHCKKARTEFQNKEIFKKLIGSMILHNQYRELIPSLLYRIVRCDADADYGVFQYIGKRIKAEESKKLYRIPYNSIVASLHLIYNEFWTYPIPENPTKILEDRFNQSLFGILDNSAADYIKDWPNYNANDNYFLKTFSNFGKTKILVMNGELDPLTTVAEAKTQFKNIKVNNEDEKQIVILPYSNHFVAVNSLKGVEEDCAFKIILSFLLNGEVDDSCIKNIPSLAFGGESTHSKKFYGCYSPSAWECDYVERTTDYTIDFQLFILIEGITVIFFVLSISILIYFVIPKKKNTEQSYQNLPSEEK